MVDTLLWILHHFAACYAGQTTQGGKDDGDGGDPDSGSKDAPKKVTGLLQRADSLRRTRALQKTKAPDQRSASSSVDPQPEKRRKGGHWLRNIFKPQPEPLPSTLHDPPQSDEIAFPVCVRQSEAKIYNQNWKPGQYNAFIEEEDSPPPRCHLPDPLVLSDKQSVAQCMSSRPPNIMLPYELVLQRYLSRPGHKNPYVPKVIDYITLEDEFIVVMEYFGGKWVTLANYLEEKIRLDVSYARDIIREIVKAMLSLKQCGIVHGDLNAGNVMYNPETSEVKLIDFGVSTILPGWKKGKSSSLNSLDSLSRVLGYKAGYDEIQSMRMLGDLLYRAMTGNDVQLDDFNYGEFMREAIPDESDSSKTLLLSTSIAHLVVECEQATGHRIQSGLVPAIQKSRLRLLGRALDPGVENVYTWLRGGVLNGEADLDQRWLDGTVEHESMGTRHDNRALAARVS
ncbi:hypothetical protein BASA61_008369 [Batrachochytrium salamandrivorans]|nr:hypothetical protein BASA61_008369 [Batrachochytrium salamandrivorans]